MSWHRQAELSLGPRQSQLSPSAAHLACPAAQDGPAQGGEFLLTAQSTRSKRGRTHSRQNQLPVPRPTAPFRQIVRPQPIPRPNRVCRQISLQAQRKRCFDHTLAAQIHGGRCSIRLWVWPLMVAVNVLAIQARGSTMFVLQVSISHATAARFSAPASAPATRAFFGSRPRGGASLPRGKAAPSPP